MTAHPLATPLEPAVLQRLAQDVYEASGIHLGERQEPLLLARLCARLAELGLRSLDEYEERLRSGDRGAEMDVLLDRLAIHESYFFRETPQLDLAVGRLVPQAQAAHPGERVRVWSAGCAAGEEPYSLVMLLQERGVWQEGAFDLLGTDLSPSCVERARRGAYSGPALRDTTPARRARFFERAGAEWRLRESVRRCVRLRRLNLYRSRDLGVLGRFDLILCRNVLLYMDAAARERVVAALSDRLRPCGTLVVGRTETLLNVASALETTEIDGEVVYRRTNGGPA